MPEPGMGANNDHSASSVGGLGGAASSNDNTNSTSSANDTTTADISKDDTTAEGLSRGSSPPGVDGPTTAQQLADPPTTEQNLCGRSTHSYDEVPSIAVSLDSPKSLAAPNSDDTTTPKSQPPAGIPNEYASLFGLTPNPVGGVDAVWSNGDGTFSSSDGSTYDPSTGKGTYDPKEDSFAVSRTSTGISLDGKAVEQTVRDRHPDRVRTSEALALVQHDPKHIAKAHGNRVAFDYYNNPNMDSIRDEALMHASNAAGAPVSGRYPAENLAYFGAIPLTAHLARSIRTARPSQIKPDWTVSNQITDRLPASWTAKPNKKGVGARYQDPNNPGNGVRVDKGNPNHSLPTQQVDHVVVRQNGAVIGRNGTPIQGSIKQNAEQAHIPLQEYQSWRSWDSP